MPRHSVEERSRIAFSMKTCLETAPADGPCRVDWGVSQRGRGAETSCVDLGKCSHIRIGL